VTRGGGGGSRVPVAGRDGSLAAVGYGECGYWTGVGRAVGALLLERDSGYSCLHLDLIMGLSFANC